MKGIFKTGSRKAGKFFNNSDCKLMDENSERNEQNKPYNRT